MDPPPGEWNDDVARTISSKVSEVESVLGSRFGPTAKRRHDCRDEEEPPADENAIATRCG